MLVDEVRQGGLFALFFIFSPLWVAEFFAQPFRRA